MTILGRTSWRIAVVTVLLLAAMPALAGDREDISSPAGIGALGRGDGWSIGASDAPHYGFLTREIARQAFLIAVREECGTVTRDAWLGDVMPASGETRAAAAVDAKAASGDPKAAVRETAPFDLLCSAGKSSLLELAVRVWRGARIDLATGIAQRRRVRLSDVHCSNGADVTSRVRDHLGATRIQAKGSCPTREFGDSSVWCFR